MVLKTLDEYYSFIKKMSSQTRKLIFRGHSSEKEHKLIPGIGRYKDADNKPFDVVEERKMINSFIKKGYLYLKTEYTPIETMTTAQHYGLPTRLLDWTWNPLVAVFFAIENDDTFEEDGAIYFLEAEKFKLKTSHDTYSVENWDPLELLEEIVLYEPKYLDSRITAQSGLFSIHKHPNNIVNDNRIKKIIISKKLKAELGVILETMGIHSGNLFPGLEGTSKHIKWLYTY